MSGRRALPALDGFRWVAALLAVPFFFMTTGCFMAAHLNDSAWLRRQVNRLAAMYGAAVVAYLPLNAYAGVLNRLDFGACLRALLLNGTFYHLWYLPAAMLGLCIAWALLRAGGMKSALAVSGALYALLFCGFSHTRNGLFFAPLFLVLGGALGRRRPNVRTAAVGLRCRWRGCVRRRCSCAAWAGCATTACTYVWFLR